jgi:hypothetical protein
MSKTIEEILAPKPEARPRIYAYSIDDKAHAALLGVGQMWMVKAFTYAFNSRYKSSLPSPCTRGEGLGGV